MHVMQIVIGIAQMECAYEHHLGRLVDSGWPRFLRTSGERDNDQTNYYCEENRSHLAKVSHVAGWSGERRAAAPA
jgi:hypothetical protein